MNRTFSFLVCAGALILAGCTSDSKLPNPSGKGTVRAIHPHHGWTQVEVDWDNGRHLMLSLPDDVVEIVRSDNSNA